MESQLLDRLSFPRFVCLHTSSQIPDHMTIWTFKERLIKAGASDTAVETVYRQLFTYDYMAQGGQVIGANIVQTPKQSIKRIEKNIVAEQATPLNWSPAKRRQKDVEACWTEKHGKSYFGYKLSVNADKRYQLIRQIKISTASEHNTLQLEAVINPTHTSRAVYADNGYVNGEREARFKSNDRLVHIQRKGNEDKLLSEAR